MEREREREKERESEREKERVRIVLTVNMDFQLKSSTFLKTMTPSRQHQTNREIERER